MKIIGPSGTEYNVICRQYGWSYAHPNIYIVTQRKFLWFKFETKKLVSDQNPRSPWRYRVVTLAEAENMLKPEMKEWFQAAVNYYEERKKSWKKD